MVEIKDNKTGQSHPTILSEGMPSVHLLNEEEKRYFQFTIDDDSIEKVTIQLTAIHGDPDLFVTNNGKTPTEKVYTIKSTKYGVYPDIIEFRKNRWHGNIKATYKVMVTSWQETTFSLVYYTHAKDGTIGVQKLAVGKAQTGVLTPQVNVSESDDVFKQTGHIYHF
jgi:hypothetical protein